MAITGKDREKLSDWLKHKCPGLVCAACGEKHWGAADIVYLPQSGQSFPGPSHQAVVPVVCQTCGYTILFDWLTIRDAEA